MFGDEGLKRLKSKLGCSAIGGKEGGRRGGEEDTGRMKEHARTHAHAQAEIFIYIYKLLLFLGNNDSRTRPNITSHIHC